MILEYARKKGGVIVTRDQYRDSYDRCPEFKEVIEKRWEFEVKRLIKYLRIYSLSEFGQSPINNYILYRLLQFNFINDDVIFPRDPLGKSGPSLDEFLRF